MLERRRCKGRVGGRLGGEVVGHGVIAGGQCCGRCMRRRERCCSMSWHAHCRQPSRCQVQHLRTTSKVACTALAAQHAL
jgi:hypothetical protein